MFHSKYGSIYHRLHAIGDFHYGDLDSTHQRSSKVKPILMPFGTFRAMKMSYQPAKFECASLRRVITIHQCNRQTTDRRQACSIYRLWTSPWAVKNVFLIINKDLAYVKVTSSFASRKQTQVSFSQFVCDSLCGSKPTA